ncbi:hypothetical protein ABEF95_006735 [Exophiala dermatitidis]
MNPMLKDPAAGVVPPQLLSHLHLVSKYRYPLTSNPSFETIVAYLLEAPKIVRDLQPVQWQFLEAPPDGTLLLTWQPLEHLGTNFASDGYIWADAEHVFTSEVRGYTLEMYLQRSGYRAAGGEPMASHSRRRYRLLPGNPNLGLPNPDPSLFLVHYSKASPRDHVPVASIPVLPQVHAQLQQRRMIQSQGQLPRNEFMLHDRSSWPTIRLPPAVARAVAPPAAAAAPAHRRGTSIVPDTTLEEEEDVSRGDLLDFLSPREISRVRYEQHHEWMEEILESPYPTLSIVPSDLGLGRKGPLEELTKDFFDAPMSAKREPTNGPPPRVGKLPEGQADEFAKRATAKLADMQAELEKMKKIHTRRMQSLTRSTVLKAAEKKLRMAPTVPEKRRLSDEAPGDRVANPRDAMEEIMREVETKTGKKLHEAPPVRLVAKGGYQEPKKPVPVQSQSGPAPTTTPQTTTGTAAAAQQSTQQQPVTTTQEHKAEDKQPPASSSQQQTNISAGNQATPSAPQQGQASNDAAQAQPGSGNQSTNQAAPDNATGGGGGGGDVVMDGVDESASGNTAQQDGNDWVMVDEAGGQSAGDVNIAGHGTADQQPQGSTPAADGTEQTPQAQTTSQTQTPSMSTQPQPAQETSLDTPHFDIGGDFDNVDVDTAGDALASYGQDEELNLDTMEDSAFGDAFHPEDEQMS